MSLTPILVSPGNTSLINNLPMNPCLRVYFWGTIPQKAGQLGCLCSSVGWAPNCWVRLRSWCHGLLRWSSLPPYVFQVIKYTPFYACPWWLQLFSFLFNFQYFSWIDLMTVHFTSHFQFFMFSVFSFHCSEVSFLLYNIFALHFCFISIFLAF